MRAGNPDPSPEARPKGPIHTLPGNQFPRRAGTGIGNHRLKGTLKRHESGRFPNLLGWGGKAISACEPPTQDPGWRPFALLACLNSYVGMGRARGTLERGSEKLILFHMLTEEIPRAASGFAVVG